jgi:predicted RNase H-like HicB family nuclease
LWEKRCFGGVFSRGESIQEARAKARRAAGCLEVSL